MNMILRGRLVLQGIVLGEFYRDMRKMKEKKTSIGMLIVGTWASLKAGVATMGIWLPLVKARAVGQVATAGVVMAARITGPPTIGYALGAVAGTAIAEAAFGEGEMAWDLYTNPDILRPGGILYEVGEIPAHILEIGEHYADAGYFSGMSITNPAHPQYREAGAVTAYRQMYGY